MKTMTLLKTEDWRFLCLGVVSQCLTLRRRESAA